MTTRTQNAETGATVLQFGRQVPVSADGTHVEPAPTGLDLDHPLRFSGETEGTPLPQIFTVATQLLAQGRTDYALAVTDRLQIVIKCYASGGENYLHAHTEEDHAFIVLQGEATFFGPKGPIGRIGRNRGVLIPRGALYSFQSSAPEPLVLLRAGVPWPGNQIVAREGHERKQDARDQTYPEAVPLEGRFYR